MDNISSIGDVATKVAERVHDRMATWLSLGAVAALARSRGARLSVVEQGFVVSRGTKSEVVPFDGGDNHELTLEKAIDRVAPEIDG